MTATTGKQGDYVHFESMWIFSVLHVSFLNSPNRIF